MTSFTQLNRCWRSCTHSSEQEKYDECINPQMGIGAGFSYVFDHHSATITYVDPGIEDILGYEAHILQREGFIFLDRIIHPLDHPSAVELLKKAWNLIMLQPEEYRKSYSLTIDYRLCHKDGYYLHFIAENKLLGRDSSDFNRFSLCTFYDITHWQKTTPSTLNLYYNNKLIERWYAGPTEGTSSISRREKEVIRLICQGQSSAQVADRLNISKNTVTTHRKAIMRKLGIKGMNALMRYALQHQLI
ncbi:MAG: LuxR C-terminal-related transcriptional regulator [Cyclobacteriaceae bacterium]